ncbi:MAG: hypothetical protein P9L92_17445 [Candidatus Electryonea clarkiae]|nr:hypothetical protein [Candidatus Electryonea clarkiae]MDP8287288.1 hypothetical protein [Candidatus Electryonea clarkiae]
MVNKTNISILAPVIPLILAMGFFITGCSDDDNNSTGFEQDILERIFALGKDNLWHYQIYEDGDSTGSYEKYCRSYRLHNTYKIFQITKTESNYVSEVIVGDQGYYRYDEGADGLSEPALWWKFPTETGDTYSSLGYHFTVISTDSTTTVPAGTFDGCYVYQYYFLADLSWDPYYTTRFIKPTIGEVYSKVDYIVSSRIVEHKLIGYDISGD